MSAPVDTPPNASHDQPDQQHHVNDRAHSTVASPNANDAAASSSPKPSNRRMNLRPGVATNKLYICARPRRRQPAARRTTQHRRLAPAPICCSAVRAAWPARGTMHPHWPTAAQRVRPSSATPSKFSGFVLLFFFCALVSFAFVFRCWLFLVDSLNSALTNPTVSNRLSNDVRELGAALTHYLNAFDSAPRMHAWAGASPLSAQAELHELVRNVREVTPTKTQLGLCRSQALPVGHAFGRGRQCGA